MADVQPLRALHYDQAAAGPLQQLVAPPYDVIDPAQREELAGARPTTSSRSTCPAGDDPYATAAELIDALAGRGRDRPRRRRRRCGR